MRRILSFREEKWLTKTRISFIAIKSNKKCLYKYYEDKVFIHFTSKIALDRDTTMSQGKMATMSNKHLQFN